MKLLLLLACFACSAIPAHAVERPKLQIINGSAQTVDVFWIRSDTERVANGSVAPGENTVITTTLGHRFAVVGRDNKAERVVTSEVPVQAMRFDPPDAEGIPAFYTQRVKAGGFPIVASAQVNPYALKEAAYLVDLMLARRPDVRAAMVKSGARLCILAWNEFTTDQPEWRWLAKDPVPGFPGISPRDFRDARARGMDGSATDPFCSCGEENLLGYPGDPYSTENILIHELAHNIHLRGMANVDPGFDARVKAAYDAAMKAGLWKGKYASVNHHEYFAEGVQSWFDDNRENDHDHNHVNTRAELLEYDAGLAALCREVFGDTVLKYTKPVTRLRDHLVGYDPAKAPKFEWPERLQQAKAAIRRQAEERSRTGATASPRAQSATNDWRRIVHRQIGTLATHDQAAAVRTMLQRWPEVDARRIGVWGWSGGGSMSLNAIFRYPDLSSTAIAVAPNANQLLYDTIFQERYMGLPGDNAEGYRDGSPLTHARHLRGNLLILHGTGEDNGHYQGTEMVMNELIAQNKAFTVRDFYGTLTRYLHEHLPVGPLTDLRPKEGGRKNSE